MKMPAMIALLVATCMSVAAMAADPQPPKIRVLLTYGGHGFEQKSFFAMFDALPGVTYTKAELPKDVDLLRPGLEKEYDVIVMYDMVKAISPDQQKAFEKLLQNGIGVVALHHNLAAHPKWDLWPKVIGAKFFLEDTELDGKKYGKSGWIDDQDMKITVVDKEHPITKGVGDFEIIDEAYNKFYVSPKAKVLLTTDHPKNDPSIAWVNEFGKSRVFYLMLGHGPKAWKAEAYPKLLLQAIRWTANR